MGSLGKEPKEGLYPIPLASKVGLRFSLLGSGFSDPEGPILSSRDLSKALLAWWLNMENPFI